MGILNSKIAERAVGVEFPISIATALALETICGLNPEKPITGKLPILEPELIYINIRTIIRNILGSVDSVIKHQLTADIVISAVFEELNAIEHIVSKYSNGLNRVAYYACSFSNLKKEFPYALMKTINSELQQHYFNLERDTIKLLLKEPPQQEIDIYDTKLNKPKGNTFLISHLPIDLLSKSNFTDLTLLETHTGNLKKPLEWNTKLTKGKDLLRMPFNKFTLQVFGDNNQLFSGQLSKVQKAVIEMAEAHKWNATTTSDRIMLGIRQVTDVEIKSILMKLI